MGAALTQAKYLAELFGNSSPAGWAVVWTDDLCRIFYPPDHDQLHVIVITDWSRQVNFEVTSREGGIQLCAPLWQEFFHIDDIPTRKEVLSLYDASRTSYVNEELEFNAADDDDPDAMHKRCEPSCASYPGHGAGTELANGYRVSDGLDR